jgi:hypothetical protein
VEHLLSHVLATSSPHKKLLITAPKTAATALACSPTSQLPTASTHVVNVTASHALDRPLSKFGFVAEHQPCPAESLMYTTAESTNSHAQCHCRCILPFLPVVFTPSLGLPIIQTYRQPLLPISSVLSNSPLSHCVIPTLFRQALDNPRPKSQLLSVYYCASYCVLPPTHSADFRYCHASCHPIATIQQCFSLAYTMTDFNPMTGGLLVCSTYT